MKNFTVSTLTAIALALPLGIVGMAGGTNTAQAVSAAYHFSTCSDDVIWRCHRDVQNAILFDGGYNQIFSSAAALPRGSNGKDQGTYGALRWRVENNFNRTGSASLRYLLQFFPDDDVREFNRGRENTPEFFLYDVFHGTISPDDRLRFERHSTSIIRSKARLEREAAELENRNNELVERYRANCNRHNGQWDEDGGPLGRGSCLAFQSYDSGGAGVYRHDEFVGYNPDDPYGYVRRLNDVIVPDEASDRFVRTCNQAHGTVLSFPEHGVLNCSVPTSETFNGQTHIDSDLYSFRPEDNDLGFDNPDIALAPAEAPELQVTVIDPIANSAAIGDIAAHRDATVATRAALVDLQNDHNFVEDQLRGLIDANTLSIGSVGERMDSFDARLSNVQDSVDKNSDGVALSMAIPNNVIGSNEKFRVGAGVANFRGKSAFGVSVTARLSGGWVTSVGGGITESSPGIRGEVSYGW